MVFNLFDADILPAPDDDVFVAARDFQVPVGVQAAEVAGSKPSVGGKDLVVEVRIEVSDKKFRTPDQHFTDGT